MLKIAGYILVPVALLALGVFSFLSYRGKETKRLILPSPSVFPSPTAVAIPTNGDSCKKLGGRWQSVDTPDNRSFCNLPTADGGKACTDSSQCESYCQAEEGAEKGSQTTGRCYAWKETRSGCMREVKNGIFGTERCY